MLKRFWFIPVIIVMATLLLRSHDEKIRYQTLAKQRLDSIALAQKSFDNTLKQISFARTQDSIEHVEDSIRIVAHADIVAKNEVRNRERVVVIRQALPDTLKPVLDSIVQTHATTDSLLKDDIKTLQTENTKLILQRDKALQTANDLNAFNKKLASDLAKAYKHDKPSTLSRIATHAAAFAIGTLF